MTWNVFVICFYLEAGDLSKVIYLGHHSCVNESYSKLGQVFPALVFYIVDEGELKRVSLLPLCSIIAKMYLMLFSRISMRYKL